MLKIISRLELTVHHMILFHPHKGGIRIGLGIAVAVSAIVDLLRVFLEFLHISF